MNTITLGGALVESLTLTKAWGLSPASASFTAVGTNPPRAGDEISVTIDQLNFQGIVRNSERDYSFSGGEKHNIQCVDFRWKLRDDVIFCYFNRAEAINDSEEPCKRIFTHVLPENWDKFKVTCTEEPMTAKEILREVLRADTVGHGWTMKNHPALERPVFSADAEKGKELGAFIQEILDQVGLILTIDSDVALRVGVKGSEPTPSIPSSARDWKLGEALTDAGTKVHIVGDRNVFQGVWDLVPGWNREWEKYWDEPTFTEFVREAEGIEVTDTREAYARLAARAREITVGEIVEAKGDKFIDRRLYGEVSRMEIPAWIYLQDIVWKFYEFPTDGSFPFDTKSIQLNPSLLQGLIYQAETGKHALKEDDFYPDAAGFVTAKGQPLDLWDPDRTGELSAELLDEMGDYWSSVSGFKIVNGRGTNKGILFEDVVFYSNDLFIFPNRDEEEVTDDVKFLAIPNPDCTIHPAEVKASLAIQHAVFRVTRGSGRRQDTVHQPGLAQHIVSDSSTPVQGTDGTGNKELTYCDGEAAIRKANELAATLLERNSSILSGGYTRPGHAGTVLTSSIDRISVSVSFGAGITETVDFADERQVRIWDSERELERRRKSRSLFPGQVDLKQEVKTLRQTADALKHQGRQKEKRYENLAKVNKLATTNMDCGPKMIPNVDEEAFNAGEIIWKSTAVEGISAEDDDTDSKAFAGVVIPRTTKARHIPVATQGIVPVLVQGPVEPGDQIGADPGTRFGAVDGEKQIGVAVDPIPDARKLLIRVRLGAGGGGASCRHWKPIVVEDGIMFKDGMINSAVANNIGETIQVDLAGDQLRYIYADVSVGSGNLSFDIAVQNQPVSSSTEEEAEAPPASFKVLLGTILSGQVKMMVCRNLVAVPYETRRTGGGGGEDLPFTRHFTWAVSEDSREEFDNGYYLPS